MKRYEYLMINRWSGIVKFRGTELECIGWFEVNASLLEHQDLICLALEDAIKAGFVLL